MAAARGGTLSESGTSDHASMRLCDAASRGDQEKLLYLVNGLGLDVDLGDYDRNLTPTATLT